MKLNEIKIVQNSLIEFSRGNFFTKIAKLRDGTALFNEQLPRDLFLNYVTNINSKDIKKFILKIEKLYVSKGSMPSFYILPNTVPKNAGKILVKIGYVKFSSDAWMSFDLNKNVNSLNNDLEIRQSKKEELEIVKHIFNEVFSKGEKDDVYKNLPRLYGEILIKQISGKQKYYKSEMYVAIKNNKIIGICNLLYDRGTAVLESLAVLPKYRKLGAAKSLLYICVKRSQELKLRRIFLITEKGSRNEKIFMKCGFKTVAVAKQLYKDFKA